MPGMLGHNHIDWSIGHVPEDVGRNLELFIGVSLEQNLFFGAKL